MCSRELISQKTRFCHYCHCFHPPFVHSYPSPHACTRQNALSFCCCCCCCWCWSRLLLPRFSRSSALLLPFIFLYSFFFCLQELQLRRRRRRQLNKQQKKTSSDALLLPVSLFWSSSLFSSLLSGVKALRFHP